MLHIGLIVTGKLLLLLALESRRFQIYEPRDSTLPLADQPPGLGNKVHLV